MVTVVQRVICAIGLIDMGMMTATVLGYTRILKIEVPQAAMDYLDVPYLDLWWFGLNALGCLLFWIASINVCYFSMHSNPMIFRRHVFFPWCVMGLIVLVLSLLGHSFDMDRTAAITLIFVRTLFLFTLWLCLERWDWEQLNFGWQMEDDEEDEDWDDGEDDLALETGKQEK